MQTTQIVLSGVSGLIGSALMHRFGKEQIPYYRLVRRTASINGSEVYWDPEASNPIPEASMLDGVTAAIHLGGANIAGQPWTEAYKRELISSRLGPTRILAETLASLRNKPHTFLCASAIGFYGQGDEPKTEESAPGEGFLAELCRDWERATEPAVAAGIRVVHLRFGVVLGPGGGVMSKVLPLFRCGLGGKLGSGRQWMSWISLQDAVRAIVFLLNHPEVKGAVNLVAPVPVTNSEFTRALGHLLHRPAAFPAPSFLLKLVFGQMAQETMLASTRAVPARLQAAGFEFEYPRIEEGLRAALQ